jgi:protein-disulfide isomerase
MKKRNIILSLALSGAICTGFSAVNTQTNDASYSLGYMTGKQISQQLGQDTDINTTKFVAGINAAITNTKPELTQEQMQTAIQAFQKSMMAKQQAEQIEKVLANKDQLLNGKTPVVGPKDAKVAVIEFYDYQCAFCSLVSPAIEKVMSDNKNIKFVFKDDPIFAQRWPASNYAAEVGLVAYKQGGADMFIKYHDAIFNSGKDEGNLLNADIDKIATDNKVDLSNTEAKAFLTGGKKVPESIQDNMKLAQELGFSGTPAIVVMPIANANKDNITVFSGFPGNPRSNPTESSAKAIQAAIDKASGAK